MKAVLLAFLALPLSLLAEGGLPNQPYIYVEGTAEIEKPADLVTLRFDLVARNAEQLKANREIQSKAIRILASLDEKKIQEKDVVAADIQSAPEFDEPAPGHTRKLIGYTVKRSFAIQLRDIAAFPKLVDELIGVNGVEFSEITASLSNEKDLHDELWKKALADAREQAEKTLKEMGMKIDSVFGVSPAPFPEIQHKMFAQKGERVVVTGAMVPPLQYRLAPVWMGQSVHVIYLTSPVAK